MTSAPFSFRLESLADTPIIDAHHPQLFGPDWVKRAAYLLREGVRHDPNLSYVATKDGKLAASVRLTPITIGKRPALILGPLMVLPAYQGQGAGKALVRMALDTARNAGHKVVLLVGDLPYYGPLGFTFLGRDVITLPAWVDKDRVLVAGLVPGALDGLSGAASGCANHLRPNIHCISTSSGPYDLVRAALHEFRPPVFQRPPHP